MLKLGERVLYVNNVGAEPSRVGQFALVIGDQFDERVFVVFEDGYRTHFSAQNFVRVSPPKCSLEEAVKIVEASGKYTLIPRKILLKLSNGGMAEISLLGKNVELFGENDTIRLTDGDIAKIQEALNTP